VEMAQVRRDLDLLQYLNFKQAFSGFRVLGREKSGDKSVLVIGAVARDGSRIKLYFDESSGLLFRFAGQTKTPYGMLPDITDLEDYRKVGGVALPFRIKRSRPPSTVVQEFKDVRINEPIDDSLLAPPRR